MYPCGIMFAQPRLDGRTNQETAKSEAKEMAPWLGTLSALKRTWVWFLALTKPLTTAAYNSL